jgi:chromosome segregation ATPase
MSDSLAVEKDAREKWIQRYEKEHSALTELTTEHVKLEAELKQIEIQKTSMLSTIASLNSRIDLYQEKHSSTLTSLHTSESTITTLNRKIASIQSLLSTIESTHSSQLAHLQGKHKSLEEIYNTLLEENSIKESIIKEKEEEIKNYIAKITEVEQKIIHTEQLLSEEREKSNRMHEQLEKEKEKVLELEYEIEVMGQEIQEAIQAMEGAQMEREEAIGRMQEFIRRSEEAIKINQEVERANKKIVGKKREMKETEERWVQTERKDMVSKGTGMDLNSELNELNEPSLVNTLTTSLGGIPLSKERITGMQSLLFAPSPQTSDSAPMNLSFTTSNPNKLKTYLKSSKLQNQKISEENVTKASYSTKHAWKKNRPNLRQSGLSPISHANYMNRKSTYMKFHVKGFLDLITYLIIRMRFRCKSLHYYA